MPQIELVPRSALTTTKWWSKLNAGEQRLVLLETQSFVEHRVRCGLSRLAMGKHLLAIKEVLDHKGLWTAFLKSQCNFSRATAFRYIAEYQRTAERLPEIILRVAIATGYDTIDAKTVEKLPPPKTTDRAKIVTYLKKLSTAASDRRKRTAEPEELDSDAALRECLHFVKKRFERLPSGSRSRNRWLEQFVGMLIDDLGIKEEHSFTPVPVPSNLRVLPGRPRLDQAA